MFVTFYMFIQINVNLRLKIWMSSIGEGGTLDLGEIEDPNLVYYELWHYRTDYFWVHPPLWFHLGLFNAV